MKEDALYLYAIVAEEPARAVRGVTVVRAAGAGVAVAVGVAVGAGDGPTDG
jgi:hypothetical protein